MSNEKKGRRRSRAPLDGRSLLSLAQRAASVALQHTSDASARAAPTNEVCHAVENVVSTSLAATGRRPRLARADELGPPPSAEWALLIDAIDGLDAYRARLPTWTVSLALLHRGQPWSAAVVAPALRDSYVASSGSLRWQGRVVSAAQPRHDALGLVLGSGLEKRSILRLRRKRELQGSVSYHGCLVARGAAQGAVLGRLTWRRAAILQALLAPAGAELVFRRSGQVFELGDMPPERRSRDVLVATASGRAAAVLARLKN